MVLLAHHFLTRYQAKYRKPEIGLASAALRTLADYPWPGNVRELDHTLERAVLMARDNQIQPCDLALPNVNDTTAPCFPRMTLEELERWAIRGAMDRHDSDITRTAEALGLSRAALYRRLEKYQIE